MIDWRHWLTEPILAGGLIFLGWLHAMLAAGFSATDDQLLAGVMMKIVRMIVALGSIGGSFRRGSREPPPDET